MVLKQIELQNFRLHKSTSLEFSDKLNLIVGGNGQGKTTILEAIYYLCTTKNINLASDSDVISFGEKFFSTRGAFSQFTLNQNTVYYDLIKNKKTYFIDEKQETKATEIIGRFPVVTLTQSDHAITQGAPSERRRFIDSVITQSSKTYLEILLDYSKTLRQRSSLLSQIKETRNSSLNSQLDSWTQTLIKNGSVIIGYRKKFVEEFIPFVKQAYLKVVEKYENPKINYQTITAAEDNVEEAFAKEIELVKEEEIRRGINLICPHRDDYMFFVNDKELKRFGSQGQHKTFQIALRFAQFFFMKEKLGKTPIFLMDDIFGELDSFRANKISTYLEEIGQAFITMTDLTKKEVLKINHGNKIIEVVNGKTTYA